MFFKFIYKSNILQAGMFYRILGSIVNDKPKGWNPFSDYIIGEMQTAGILLYNPDKDKKEPCIINASYVFIFLFFFKLKQRHLLWKLFIEKMLGW